MADEERTAKEAEEKEQSDVVTAPAGTIMGEANGGGGYEVLKPVGKGKFAVVYRARRVRDGEIVALKRVKCDQMDEKQRAKALKEVKLVQSLNHPNIVQYLDSWYEGNELVIALEFVAAGDLKRQIRKANEKQEFLDERIVWNYFSQIADAIKYMHEQRIMHRDLKPANIFLTLTGQVKVGDLGLGRQLSEQTMQGGAVHSKVGTPLYMSPEVLHGDGYNFSSDVWSVGCLLYELAMLKSPFKAEGLNLYKLFQKISRGDYLPLPNQYSKELVELAYAMLNLDPNLRPSLEEVTEVSSHYKQLTNAGVRPRQDASDERPYFGDAEFDYIKNDYDENHEKKYEGKEKKKNEISGESDSKQSDEVVGKQHNEDTSTTNNGPTAVSDVPIKDSDKESRSVFISKNASLKEQNDDGVDADSEDEENGIPSPPPERPMSHRKQYKKGSSASNNIEGGGGSIDDGDRLNDDGVVLRNNSSPHDDGLSAHEDDTPYATHRKSFTNMMPSDTSQGQEIGIRKLRTTSKTSKSNSSANSSANTTRPSETESLSKVGVPSSSSSVATTLSSHSNQSNQHHHQGNGNKYNGSIPSNDSTLTSIKGNELCTMEVLWHKLDVLGYFKFRKGLRDKIGPATPLEAISPFSPRAPKQLPPLLQTHFAFSASLSSPWIASPQQQFLDFVHTAHWLLDQLGLAKEFFDYEDENASMIAPHIISRALLVAVGAAGFPPELAQRTNPASLSVGYGEAPLEVLMFLTDRVIKTCPPSGLFHPPQYQSEGTDLHDEGDEGEEGNDDEIDDDEVELDDDGDGEDEVYNGGGGVQVSVGIDDIDKDQALHRDMLWSPVENSLWLEELERVRSRLASSSNKNNVSISWRERVDVAKLHAHSYASMGLSNQKKEIVTSRNNNDDMSGLSNGSTSVVNNGNVMKVKELGRKLKEMCESSRKKELLLVGDPIIKGEYGASSSLGKISLEHKECYLKCQELDTKIKELKLAISSKSNELSSITSNTEELEAEVDTRGEATTNTEPLKLIKEAGPRLLKQIKELDISEGILSYQLFRSSSRYSTSYDENNLMTLDSEVDQLDFDDSNDI